jgi:hypothetical protein
MNLNFYPSDTLMVQEFVDIISNDLPGLLPERGVEFCIELQSNTQQNFTPPY